MVIVGPSPTIEGGKPECVPSRRNERQPTVERMSKRTSPKLPRIAVDDRRLSDAIIGVYAFPAVLVAHKLGLFEAIGRKALTIDEIAERLHLNVRPTTALLACVSSLGLAMADSRGFRLTPLGAQYLLKESPTYWGYFLDFFIETRSAWSVDGIEKSVLSNVAQGGSAPEWITSQIERDDFARRFTRTMHSISMAPALAWPAKVNLSEHSVMLDIAGGSGAHSIGAAIRWKKLKAIVFEIPAVCEIATECAAEYGLDERVTTQRGDMWTDPFPSADLHFYSQIYHDWPPEKCRELTQKSFGSLPSGGRIIVHEMLFNPAKTGPLSAAAMNMTMMALTQGQQFTGDELRTMLRDAGFRNVQVKPTFGHWSIVTGKKP